MTSIPLPTIVVDSREQRPYLFSGHQVVRAALPTGDYSIQGLENLVAVERKELGDLVNCCTFERERFERELARGADLKHFAIVIEASMGMIEEGRYRSKATPAAILGSLAAWSIRYGVGIWLAGSRESAERLVLRIMRHAWKEHLAPSKAEESTIECPESTTPAIPAKIRAGVKSVARKAGGFCLLVESYHKPMPSVMRDDSFSRRTS